MAFLLILRSVGVYLRFPLHGVSLCSCLFLGKLAKALLASWKKGGIKSGAERPREKRQVCLLSPEVVAGVKVCAPKESPIACASEVLAVRAHLGCQQGQGDHVSELSCPAL